MKTLFIGTAALALVATAAAAETPTKAQFVEKAGASDTFEIDSARLMVTSKNPAIKTFATQMLTDHTKSTKMVQAAAKADHVVLKKPSLSVGQRPHRPQGRSCGQDQGRSVRQAAEGGA